MLKHAVKTDSVVKFSAVASCACCLCTPGARPADEPKGGIPLLISLLLPTVLAPSYRTWWFWWSAEKNPYCSVVTVKNRQCFDILRLELFFVRFTVKGTVLQNSVFLFNMLWQSAVRPNGL
jgi:hypothetical protein